ncbi:peroxiredoxin Q/BCP [Chitinophaga terrae (ex Kim and Jung 2007)]|jgi:peroxiredoxin Q/BCP|uniref:thioredoxin-dependent peroxiredoxin n=1 Tax=Chitinophaga terrae (ex Kim and Jung 2007) TaxID=408074 RepID=A0A1H4B383_9BACT|nr:peroxiredoxin [Chitinophaga terrae (ex Kim and Jung 2007)]MDQ0106408.1 peroxiredoxin Q/BCP [Chitinophaga terrae (ex Kim and Jung 2007)]SEA42623.1 peroxiredoxin Q/BCP [Chitinophaga terrae (ex Kim and Jung 2007)]
MAFLQFWSPDADAQIKVGDKVPEFQLPDQDGKMFDLKSVVGKQPLVIYFYPKDETSVCTKEACSFRDNYQDFQKYGAKVIGISGDDVASHRKFADHHQLPFTLLSDTKNDVRKLFGVPKTFVIPGRVTYIVDKNGVVVHTFNSMKDGPKHVTEALDALKKMQQ